jgi:hypothetical protein
LVNVGIQAAIAAAQAARSERTAVTQGYVVSRLVIEAERVGEDGSHQARIAALKLLGEHLGLFGDVATVRKLLELEREEDARDGVGDPPGDAGPPIAGRVHR